MRPLPGFSAALVDFVQEEAFHEADGILKNKDPPVKEFSLDSLENFSYTEQLAKLQRTNPILVACIKGSIRKLKIKSDVDLTRKGFGGNAREGIWEKFSYYWHWNLTLVPWIIFI